MSRPDLVHRHVRDRGVVPLRHELRDLFRRPLRIRQGHVVVGLGRDLLERPGMSIDAVVVARRNGGVSCTRAGAAFGTVTM